MAWLKKYFYFLPVLFYSPVLGNFFSGDDWFHLRITQISSFGQFLNFFSFSQNAQTAAFYRPLSTQVFFFLFQKVFGLTAWPYYLFGLILFTYSISLVRRFSGSSLAAFLYALSVSNFTRLYFLSAYQELFLVIFSLLTLLHFKKKPALAVLFFLLALLSKETAVVLPLLLLLFNFSDLKKQPRAVFVMGFVFLVYLYFRFFHFGLAAGDSYLWNFSPVKAANTLTWYLLWSFGAPELLVDYVGSGLRLVPKFFLDYPQWWPFVIFPLLGTIFSVLLLGFRKLKKIGIQIIRYKLFFLLSLLPVLFLPAHKFTLELGLPLVGFVMILAWIIPKKLDVLSWVFLSFFVFLNLSMNYLTYTRHYSVSRGAVSRKVYVYFSQNYPSYPSDRFFEFANDTLDYGREWGSSKQISQALSRSDFFQVFYQNTSAEVFYADYHNPRPKDLKPIPISSRQFLNP